MMDIVAPKRSSDAASAITEIMARARVGLVLNIGVTSRLPDALAFIQGLEGVTGAEIQDDFIRVTMDSEKGNAASVAEQLFKSGFSISRLEEEQVNLETAFMRLTKGLVQ